MKKFRICYLIITAAVLAGSIFCLHPSVPAQASVSEPDAQAAGQTAGTTRILVLGCDRAAALTDSILLVSLEAPSGALRILQLPRDTYAVYTDRDYKKLNGAYAVLGLDGMKQFLSQSLGVSIDYAAALDLDCVSSLVDAVGGVDVEITQPMQYTDPSQNLHIDLQPGMQHLDGRQAEHFLRYRSGYANADLGRMDAQKRFLQAYLQKCQSMGTGGLVRMMLAVLPKMQTDLPVQEAVRLVQLLPQADVAEVPMTTAPGEAVRGSSGAWYYSLNRADMICAVNTYLLPQVPVTDASFDPNRVYDRQDFPEFHRIYTAPGTWEGAVSQSTVKSEERT